MIIRKAVRGDLPAINDILNEAIRNTTANWSYEEQSMEAAQEWFDAHSAPNRPLLVAEEDGEIVGYGCLSAFREKDGYWPVVENSVYVHRDHRGRGVGTMLMKRLIAMGREAGLRVITAWVDAENQGSIAFHENLGFKRAGEMAGIGEKFGRRLGVTILTLDLEEGDGR
jgi:phosphinothricin acetyltransferase